MRCSASALEGVVPPSLLTRCTSASERSDGLTSQRSFTTRRSLVQTRDQTASIHRKFVLPRKLSTTDGVSRGVLNTGRLFSSLHKKGEGGETSVVEFSFGRLDVLVRSKRVVWVPDLFEVAEAFVPVSVGVRNSFSIVLVKEIHIDAVGWIEPTAMFNFRIGLKMTIRIVYMNRGDKYRKKLYLRTGRQGDQWRIPTFRSLSTRPVWMIDLSLRHPAME